MTASKETTPEPTPMEQRLRALVEQFGDVYLSHDWLTQQRLGRLADDLVRIAGEYAR